MLDKTDLVAIRDATPSDKNFIMATFLRGLYYGDSWFKDISKDIFMGNYHTILENLLAHPSATIKVACLKDDPEVILGYAIYRVANQLSVLDFVFVKSAWRRIGIAKSLVPNNVWAVTHLTKTGRFIWKAKLPGAQFNPFLL